MADPAGYTTTATYDNDDNTTSVTPQVWQGNEPDYTNLNSGFTSVTSRAAYDPLGRAVKSVDGRGNASQAAYDLLGNTVSETDARGIVTRGYTYTPDGLLEGVYEPDMNSGTSAATFDPANPSGFTKTRHYTYGPRVYPTEERRANMNTAAGATSGSKSSYTYDFAGRPTLQTLPDGMTISQAFDGRGHLLSRTNPEGFKTTFAFDSAGRMTQRREHARTSGTGATTDNAAGLANGLSLALTYDPAGNVISRTENGLVSDFTFNSLGQTQSANRPHTSGVAEQWKFLSYRLDGARTAETTYGYAGDLTSKLNTVNTGTQFPTVTAGNVIAFDLDGRGLITGEKSAGMWNGSANNWAYTSASTYDGLGQRAKRVFTGTGAIYQTMRSATGADLGNPNHNTVWKFDANGNLSEGYDTLPDGSGKQNVFTYTYSPTNRELSHTRDVQVRVQSADSANRLWNMGGSAGVLLAGTQGNASLTYNERDLPDTMSVTDAAPAKGATSGSEFSGFGPSVTKTSALGYFLDGHRYMTTTTGSLVKRVDGLDARGRETNVYDPTSTYGAVNVMSTYGADGMVTREVRRSDATTAYQEIMKPTLGGRRYSTSNSKGGENTTTFSQAGSPLVGVPYVTSGRGAVSYGYDGYGNATTQVRGGVTTTSSYDVNNGLTGLTDGTTSISYKLDGQGHRMFTTGGDFDGYATRYSAEGRVAGLSNGASGLRRFDDYRYDPFGRQVVTSTAGMNELASNGGYQLRRDSINTVGLLGVPNLITRTQELRDDTIGQTSTNSPSAAFKDLSYSAGPSYLSTTFKDLGYSFADGATDTFGYGGIASFSSTGGVGTLSAPVKALSDQLKLNPLDIKPTPSQDLPVNPGEIKPEGTTPGGMAVQGLQALSVQPLQAPKSVLPSSLNTLNPLDVKGTGSSLPSVPGADTVKRPTDGGIKPQSIIVNPADTYTETPSDLSEAWSNATAGQASTTGNYTYDDQYTATTNNDYASNMTASGTDADSYASANDTAVQQASSTEGVSAARQTRNDVYANVQAAYAQRGLTYTPDTDVSASEVNTAVTANTAAVNRGEVPTTVVGNVTSEDRSYEYRVANKTTREDVGKAILGSNGNPYLFTDDEAGKVNLNNLASSGGNQAQSQFMFASLTQNAPAIPAPSPPAGLPIPKGGGGLAGGLFLVELIIEYFADRAADASDVQKNRYRGGKNITFYRGTNYYDALDAVENQSLNIERLMANQIRRPPEGNRLGAYFTTQLSTADYYSSMSANYGGGPAVISTTVRADSFFRFARRNNVVFEAPVPRSPVPGQTETLIPYNSIREFESLRSYYLIQ
ncbi:RHS repeat protein [Deinococcus metallilatus]|uniref:YD repeat-containing protein n=1 Tax=Deinococcus metallilatus TaxID=1211322 RepID=A0ABR6MYA0_9DEIO|nr:RHS repeat protein [Deinococcus metallilatus]MBB5296912.1 YD repeat-containing protein [Deinococcus metallilatus]